MPPKKDKKPKAPLKKKHSVSLKKKHPIASKEEQNVENKNVIQQVIVKLDEGVKKVQKRRRRTAKRQPKREEVSVISSVAPAIVYQQAPMVNLPPAFTPPPPPPAFKPVAVKSLAEMATMTEPTKRATLTDVQGESMEIPPKAIKRPTLTDVQGDSIIIQAKPIKEVDIPKIEKIGDTVTMGEFPPTANFISPFDLQKAQETNEKIYTEEPETFKSKVAGDETFGISFEQLEEPTQYKIKVPKKKESEQLEIIPPEQIKTPKTPKRTNVKVYEKYMQTYGFDETKAKEQYALDIKKIEAEGKSKAQAQTIINKRLAADARLNEKMERAGMISRMKSRPSPQLLKEEKKQEEVVYVTSK